MYRVLNFNYFIDGQTPSSGLSDSVCMLATNNRDEDKNFLRVRAVSYLKALSGKNEKEIHLWGEGIVDEPKALCSFP